MPLLDRSDHTSYIKLDSWVTLSILCVYLIFLCIQDCIGCIFPLSELFWNILDDFAALLKTWVMALEGIRPSLSDGGYLSFELLLRWHCQVKSMHALI